MVCGRNSHRSCGLLLVCALLLVSTLAVETRDPDGPSQSPRSRPSQSRVRLSRVKGSSQTTLRPTGKKDTSAKVDQTSTKGTSEGPGKEQSTQSTQSKESKQSTAKATQTEATQSESEQLSNGLCLNAIRSLDDYTISRMMNGWKCAKQKQTDDERIGRTLCSRSAPWVFALFRPEQPDGTLGVKDWAQMEQGLGAGLTKSLQLMYPKDCGQISLNANSCKVNGQEQWHTGAGELDSLLKALQGPAEREAFYVHIFDGEDKTHHFVLQKHDSNRFRLIQSWQKSGAVPWNGFTVKEWLAPAPTKEPQKHQPAKTKQDHDDNIQYAKFNYGGGQWKSYKELSQDLKNLLSRQPKLVDDTAIKMFGRNTFAPTSLEWVRSGAKGHPYTQDQCVKNVNAMKAFFASTKGGQF